MNPRAPRRRLGENCQGKFYTTEDCDGCAYCASVAPENFDYAKETNTYFVSHQPRNEREEEVMVDAMDDCPLDAIRVEDVFSYNTVAVGR